MTMAIGRGRGRLESRFPEHVETAGQESGPTGLALNLAAGRFGDGPKIEQGDAVRIEIKFPRNGLANSTGDRLQLLDSRLAVLAIDFVRDDQALFAVHLDRERR